MLRWPSAVSTSSEVGEVTYPSDLALGDCPGGLRRCYRRRLTICGYDDNG